MQEDVRSGKASGKAPPFKDNTLLPIQRLNGLCCCSAAAAANDKQTLRAVGKKKKNGKSSQHAPCLREHCILLCALCYDICMPASNGKSRGRGVAQCGLGVPGGSDPSECTCPVSYFTCTFVIYVNNFRSKKTLFLFYS